MFKRTPEHPPFIKPSIGTSTPVWSVMIPVYNCLHYLKEAIESVLQQAPDYHVMQIEVVDDCSTDGDVEKLVREVGKGRVGYFRKNENTGSLRNFECCINRSKGKYIHLLHGDDKVENGFYTEVETLFNQYPNAGAAFTNFRYIDRKSVEVKIEKENILDSPGIVPDFVEKIAIKQLIQPPAMVVKRSTYETLGSFYAVHYGEDWEMWTRIGSKFPVAHSPKTLASYRVGHGIGISSRSFHSGQNLTDITKVINIIQHHLPEDERSRIKKASLAYHAQFSVKVANDFLLNNKDAAFRQINGAWKMSKDHRTLFQIIRFYAMYILRYKQIEEMLGKRPKKIFKNILSK